MIKYFLYILLFILCGTLFAQRDTLLFDSTLAYVVVENTASDYRGIQSKKFPTLSSPSLLASEIGSWLDANGLAQVNKNGAAGAASSIRFRGLAADHSNVFWNSLPLNSASLGMCDLSLLPTFLFDEIDLNTEPHTNDYSIGSMGAAIQLKTNDTDTTTFIRAYSSYNSIHNAFHGADIKYYTQGRERAGRQSGKWYARSKAYMQYAKNKFVYTDRYQLSKPEVTQVNNDSKMYGGMQVLEYHEGEHRLQAALWYQQRALKLPAPMGGIKPSDALQDDESLRASVGYRLTESKYDWQLNLSASSENQYWRSQQERDDTWLLESRMKIQSAWLNGQWQYKASDIFFIKANATASNQRVFTTNYFNGMEAIRSIQAGCTATLMSTRSRAEISARQEWRNRLLPPSWTFFYSTKISKTHSRTTWLAEFMSSNRYRVPDFNELFWQPGGNIHLKPEKSLNANAAFRMLSGNIMQRWSIRLAGFANRVYNWIQWVPTLNNYWMPINYKIVRSVGAEFEINKTFTLKNWKIEVFHRTLYTHSLGTNHPKWNQEDAFNMTYTPRYIFFNSIKSDFDWLNLSITHKYTGMRYTDEANNLSNALPAFHLFNMYADFSFASWTWGMGIENIFDKPFESVRAYAVPGRIFQLYIHYHFFKHN